MNIKTRKSLAVAIVLSAVSMLAQANTITFAPLTSTNSGAVGATYLEGGLTFTSGDGSPNGLYHWGTSQSFNADPKGSTLFENHVGVDLVVTKTGGGSFNLDSFDLADAFNTGAASVIAFNYTDGTGAHSTNLTLDTNVGLQTFAFGYAGVTSFSLRQDYPYFQLDNVTVNSVPEPETYALMAAGLLAMGFAARRKGGKSRD